MKKVFGIFLVFAVALLCLAPAANAIIFPIPSAGPMQLVGPSTTSGNGLGAVLTTVTFQNTGSESGCVAWNGSADVIGAAACPAGVAGGDEGHGASQTLTRQVSELGTTDAGNVVIIFNGSEPDNIITLDDLQLTVFDATGTIVYVSAPFGVSDVATFGPTPKFGGTGGAGQLYKLNPTDAAALNTAGVFSNPTWRIGAAGTASGTAGGSETFSLSRKCPVITLAPTSLPTATQGVLYGPIPGTVTGGVTPYTSITASPAGPYFGGIVFSSNTTAGTFSFDGTPTSSGSVSITVTASDANLCTGQVIYSLDVTLVACPTITISPSGALAPATTTAPITPVQFTASPGAGPFTFSNPDGHLAAAGLSLSASGLLTGTPNAGTAGTTITFGVHAIDTTGSPANCPADASASIFVAPVLTPPGLVNVPTLGYPALALLALALAGTAFLLIRKA